MNGTSNSRQSAGSIVTMALAAAALLASPNPAAAKLHAEHHTAGAVYTMTNATGGNAIIAYNRRPDGTLISGATYPTGGTGTGAGLGNQGGLILSENRHWLLGVNAGSNQVFLFRVAPNRLILTDVEPSGGTMPISVTENDSLVYVLNAGGSANISGFVITPRGRLLPLPSSARALNAAAGPAEVGFSSDGDVLVVTEKAASTIETWRVNDNGYAGAQQTTASAGSTPFGFAFDSEDHLFVTEAAASAATSYAVSETGTLTPISASVLTNELAACWAVVTPDDRYLYTADAHSNTISGFSIGEDGAITLLDGGLSADTGAGSTPLDMAITHNGRYLYVIEAGAHAIGAYRIGKDGSLTAVQTVSGLPSGANGIAVW